MRHATWYFDFVSPFAFIALQELDALGLAIEYRPVLFAGLLEHFGQKGPAEIAEKRKQTYRWTYWRARSRGIPLVYPAGHPFNPLHHLRLAIAAGCTPQAVRRIFDAVWTTGADAADPAAFRALCASLDVDAAALAAPQVKERLRANTDAAAARGVFGVPTLEVEGELFWGVDAMEFARAFLADPSVIDNAEVRRIDALPVSAARRGA